MIRPALTIAALLTAGTAAAQAPIAYYVAVPVAQATRTQMMTQATPWALTNGAYIANKAPQRDAVMCQLVARSVGQLQSFAVAGNPFDADALAKCNAHAK